MRTILIIFALVLAVLATGALLLSRNPEPLQASVSVAAALSEDVSAYERAMGPRPFLFPEDHGPHPGFKLEWWYYTGNVSTDAGRPFGYQFTIFRTALAPPDSTVEARSSAWATNQLYLAHFALSDVEGETFYARERFSRGAAGLAGAQAEPFRVWLEDWEVAEVDQGFLPMRIRARQPEVALDLVLEPGKPMALQGDQGYSPKGPEPGQASYYYSFTRLPTTGTVTVQGTKYQVSGLSWMDREWSTSMLGKTQLGWDWFSLQLSDGRDLMYFQLREQDPSANPHTDGLIVEADGTYRVYPSDQVLVEVLDTWESRGTGAIYPARWRLVVPTENIDVTLMPYLADQELKFSVRYWEGAVKVEGTSNGKPVSGNGYVEMTGYGDNEAMPVM